jgi:hypothetical protein
MILCIMSISNSWGARWEMILCIMGGGLEMIFCISRICFYSINYRTLFGHSSIVKNITHKYLCHLANNSIQIYFV